MHFTKESGWERRLCLAHIETTGRQKFFEQGRHFLTPLFLPENKAKEVENAKVMKDEKGANSTVLCKKK